MLNKNLKYLRKSKKQTQQEAAALVQVARTTWINFEQGTQSPRVDTLEKIAAIYAVSLEDLVHHTLWEPGFAKRQSRNSNEPPKDFPKGKSGIPLIPAAAKAGYLQGYADPEFLDSLPYVQLPDLRHGTFRAFSIEGDSMPPIHDGFIVVGQSVENLSTLKQNFRYIFITQSEGITFKRLASIEPSRQMLILCSDNPDYKPFILLFEEILEIWSFYSFIGYPEDYTSTWIEMQMQVDRLAGIVNKLDR